PAHRGAFARDGRFPGAARCSLGRLHHCLEPRQPTLFGGGESGGCSTPGRGNQPPRPRIRTGASGAGRSRLADRGGLPGLGTRGPAGAATGGAVRTECGGVCGTGPSTSVGEDPTHVAAVTLARIAGEGGEQREPGEGPRSEAMSPHPPTASRRILPLPQ